MRPETCCRTPAIFAAPLDNNVPFGILAIFGRRASPRSYVLDCGGFLFVFISEGVASLVLSYKLGICKGKVARYELAALTRQLSPKLHATRPWVVFWGAGREFPQLQGSTNANCCFPLTRYTFARGNLDDVMTLHGTTSCPLCSAGN